MFTDNGVSMLLGALILILTLFLILQEINNFKKNKDFKIKEGSKEIKENMSNYTLSSWNPVKDETVSPYECFPPTVVASNKYVDDKNDPNFQSNVLNVNRFYRKNIQNEPNPNQIKEDPDDQDNRLKINCNEDLPTTWKYKNEFVMNGGTLFNDVRGYDNLVDQTQKAMSGVNMTSCNPPFGKKRGALINDDLRMGLGTTNIGRRMTT